MSIAMAPAAYLGNDFVVILASVPGGEQHRFSQHKSAYYKYAPVNYEHWGRTKDPAYKAEAEATWKRWWEKYVTRYIDGVDGRKMDLYIVAVKGGSEACELERRRLRELADGEGAYCKYHSIDPELLIDFFKHGKLPPGW